MLSPPSPPSEEEVERVARDAFAHAARDYLIALRTGDNTIEQMEDEDASLDAAQTALDEWLAAEIDPPNLAARRGR